MTQVVVGLVAGIALGLRWKYTILLPTTFIVALAVICIGGVNWSSLGQMLLAITAIQAGYLCGVTGRPLVGNLRFVNGWRPTLHRH